MTDKETFKGMNYRDLLIHIATKQEDYEKDVDQLRMDAAARDIRINKAHARISKQRTVNTTLSAVFGTVGGFVAGLFKGGS